MIDLSNSNLIEEIKKLLPGIKNYDLLALYLEAKRMKNNKYLNEEGKNEQTNSREN